MTSTRVVVRDFNANHDELGRFSSGAQSRSMTADEISALESYAGYYSGQINAKLRTREPGRVYAQGIDRTISAMDSAFEAASPLAKEAIVFRGMSSSTKIDETKIGAIYLDKGFASTSLNRVVANDFAGWGGTLVLIKLPAGARVLNITGRGLSQPQFKKEKEVLLPRGARFRVTGHATGGRARQKIVTMELVL